MRALVVYESAFGNTEKVARAIQEGLTSHVPTGAVEVGGAAREFEDDVDLLVVGGPTHAFGMSRDSTRRDAAKKADREPVSKGQGIREWLAGVQGQAPRLAAAFDTRFKTAALDHRLGGTWSGKAPSRARLSDLRACRKLLRGGDRGAVARRRARAGAPVG